MFHRRAERERRSGDAERQRATWVVFGFAPPSLDVEKLVRDVLDEQVAGFYDARAQRLYVRARAGVDANDRLAGMILAHEVEHALQDQHFGFPSLTKLPDDDVRLARLALYEGDATMVMLAWAAQPEGLTLGDTLARATRALELLGDEALVRRSAGSPQLAQAPAIMRTLITFPYFEGMKLLGEIYRAGGFALVDQMFPHPPRVDRAAAARRQVPGRRRAGAGARAGGAAGVEAGRLGRAGRAGDPRAARVVSAAERSARGGRGVGRRRVHGAALERQARAPVGDGVGRRGGGGAVRGRAAPRAGCWPDAGKAGRWTVAPTWAVARRGSEVTLVRGLDGGDARAEALLGSAGAPVAAVPPLGVVKRAPPLVDAGPGGHIDDGHWTDDRIGLRADVPAGFRSSATTPGLAFLVFRTQPSAAFGGLQFWAKPLTGRARGRSSWRSVAQQFAAGLGGATPREENRGQGRVAFGEGRDRSWSYPGSQRRVRASVLPVVRRQGDPGVRAGVGRLVRRAVTRRLALVGPADDRSHARLHPLAGGERGGRGRRGGAGQVDRGLRGDRHVDAQVAAVRVHAGDLDLVGVGAQAALAVAEARDRTTACPSPR